MRAIVLEKFGGLDSLVYRDIPEPEPGSGHVVIEIEGFGVNHAEMHMRRGEWGELAAIPETYATAWTCLFRHRQVAGDGCSSFAARPPRSVRRHSSWRSTPARREAGPGLRLRRDPRGPPRDGGQRGRRKNGRGQRLTLTLRTRGELTCQSQ